MSTGSISRIEKGVINSTKETITRIAIALSLNSFETANLFEISIYSDFNIMLDMYLDLAELESLDEILQKSVDDIVYRLNLYSGFIALIKGNNLYAETATNNEMTKISFRIINKVFKSLHVSLDDPENLMIKAIKNRKIYISSSLIPFVFPAVNYLTANLLDKTDNLKSCIALPIIYEDVPLGSIMFGKQMEGGFTLEQEYLVKYTEVLAKIIYKYNVR